MRGLSLRFELYVGIDYSGAQTSDAGLPGLQVFAVRPGRAPQAVRAPSPARHWSRRALARWLLAQLGERRLLVGIDHGFSFPEAYFRRYRLDSWPAFFADFCRYWPTDQPGCSVQCVRDGTWWKKARGPRGTRIGSPTALRLCERWTSSSKSVFRFDFQGSVAKSTHAGNWGWGREGKGG